MNQMKVQIIAGPGVGKSAVAELLRAELAKRGVTVSVPDEENERWERLGSAGNEKRLESMAGRVEVTIEMVQPARV